MGGETGTLTLAAFLHESPGYIACLFIAGSVFAMSWYFTEYQRQQKLMEQTRKEHLEMELTFLKNQINPHFLFNSLNNLYALTVKKSDDAPEVVSRISTILRYLLYESDTRVVRFEKEKEIMQAYINLELIRMTNTANLNFTISADKDYAIPPLLWLPVLENVFKHGTRFISPGYSIDFNFVIENNVLRINSANNFNAGTDEQAKQTEGIGLRNLAQRLDLLYKGNYSMASAQENDRYTISIIINLKGK